VKERCLGAAELLPVVGAIAAHPSWSAADKLRALYGLKKEVCCCSEVCDRYQEELLASDTLKREAAAG
jgi:hypothetical protein